MIECPQCGELLPHGRMACESCGSPLVAPVPADSAQDIQRWLAEAGALRRRGEFDEAITLCTRIIRQDNENADALVLLGDIYRELGNYREALGWYQLAVQHSPGRTSIQKRLDEMIERVFPGSTATVQRPLPPASTAAEPRAARRAAGPNPMVQGLARIQPVHVVLTFAILAMVLSGIFMAKSGTFATKTKQPYKPRHVGDQLKARGVAPVATTPVEVTAPPPDTTESPGTPPAKPPTTTPAPTTPSPATTPAPNTTPASTGPSTPAPSVSPFTPPAGSSTMTAEALDRMSQQLKTQLETAAKDAKVQFSIERVLIDPRTSTVTVDYTIPRMVNAAETKKGLLFAGFEIAWSAQRQSSPPRTITLRGFAQQGNVRGASLALLADVSAAQAVKSRTATDYATLQRFLSNPWWRDDLATIALDAARGG